MKKLSKILYIVGILTILIAFIMNVIVIYSDVSFLFKLFSYITMFIGFFIILIAFIIDFRLTMILKETSGDRFTLMSKESIKKELTSMGVKYDEDRAREYYLYVIRDVMKNEKTTDDNKNDKRKK